MREAKKLKTVKKKKKRQLGRSQLAPLSVSNWQEMWQILSDYRNIPAQSV